MQSQPREGSPLVTWALVHADCWSGSTLTFWAMNQISMWRYTVLAGQKGNKFPQVNAKVCFPLGRTYVQAVSRLYYAISIQSGRCIAPKGHHVVYCCNWLMKGYNGTRLAGWGEGGLLEESSKNAHKSRK